VSIREGRKSRVESLSKTGRTPSRPVEAMLHRHLHRVKASKLPRRQFLHLAAGAATLPVVSHDARAQAYPTRPITMIVPSAAGGATDVVARILAERMRRLLEKPVIIENVSGANGSIGAGRVARAAPDGYTIIIGIVTTHVLNGALYSLQYDVMNAFAPIALLASTPLILFARSTMQAKCRWCQRCLSG
jgi:tripartite-type tricarboxylate transporter receptor subunit TctC